MIDKYVTFANEASNAKKAIFKITMFVVQLASATIEQYLRCRTCLLEARKIYFRYSLNFCLFQFESFSGSSSRISTFATRSSALRSTTSRASSRPWAASTSTKTRSSLTLKVRKTLSSTQSPTRRRRSPSREGETSIFLLWRQISIIQKLVFAFITAPWILAEWVFAQRFVVLLIPWKKLKCSHFILQI